MRSVLESAGRILINSKMLSITQVILVALFLALLDVAQHPE